MATVPTRAEGGALHDALLVLGATPDITFGPIQYENHATIPFGDFIRYTHTGVVPNGTAIGIVVSNGHAPATPRRTTIAGETDDFEPEDVIGMTKRKALKKLHQHGWICNYAQSAKQQGIGRRVVHTIERPEPGRKIVRIKHG